MVIHTGTRTSSVSFSSEFKKHLSIAVRKHGIIYQGKYKKRASKQNWTEREYHVHNYADIAQKM